MRRARPCPACERPLPRRAAVCPYCGETLPAGPVARLGRFALPLFLAAALAGPALAFPAAAAAAPRRLLAFVGEPPGAFLYSLLAVFCLLPVFRPVPGAPPRPPGAELLLALLSRLALLAVLSAALGMVLE